MQFSISNIIRFAITVLLMSLAFSFCQNKERQTSTAKSDIIDSISFIKKQLDADSLNPKTWEQYYHILINSGDTTAARNAIEHYTELVPEDVNGWIELGFIMASQKDSQVLSLTDTLRSHGNDVTKSKAFYIAGIYHSNVAQWDQAIKDYDAAILLNYSFIDPYIDKGILQYDKHQFNEAMKTFQLAFTLEKNQPDLYYWISKTFEAQGEKNAAIDWMKKYEALK
ncbi:MAG: hypothetical protein ACO29O_08645 [Chitinophagaceae bacterium]